MTKAKRKMAKRHKKMRDEGRISKVGGKTRIMSKYASKRLKKLKDR